MLIMLTLNVSTPFVVHVTICYMNELLLCSYFVIQVCSVFKEKEGCNYQWRITRALTLC